MRRTWLVLMVFLMIGCIEIKDRDQDESPAVQSYAQEEWMVVGEQVMWQGRLFPIEDLKTTSELKPLKTKMNLRKLTFTRGSVLYTMGADTEIEVEELISENGRIETFPEGARAGSGQNGRSGGHIYMRAERAQGSLTVILRGEGGGHGMNGKAPDDSLRGADGPDVTGGCNSIGDRPPRPVHVSSGHRGLKGYTGEKGGSGGNSGVLSMVLDDRLLRVTVLREPGAGGQGGVGGLGGLGGNPGRIKTHCDTVGKAKTPEELRGDSGDIGETGASGIVQEYCIASNRSTECG